MEKYTPVRFHRTPLVPASWNHWKAYLAFQALGPMGKSAIPDLAKLAHDSSGNSFYPRVGDMKDIGTVAKLADNSSSYLMAYDSVLLGFAGSTTRKLNYYWGPVRSTNSFLVDGEIAAWSLAAIGADAVSSLMELLEDPSPRLRQRAAEALGMVGAAAHPAVPALLKNLKGPDRDVRQRAADALGWIGKEPSLVVPALIEALKDPDVGVSCFAGDSLAHFRHDATSAVPALNAR